MPTLGAKIRRLSHGPHVGYIVFVVVVGVGLYVTAHNNDRERRRAQIAGCERGKDDRVDLALAMAGMANYYDGVTKAESVKTDVKLIASTVRDRLRRSAIGLEGRILLCKPAIDHGRKVPDEEALRGIPAIPAQ